MTKTSRRSIPLALSVVVALTGLLAISPPLAAYASPVTHYINNAGGSGCSNAGAGTSTGSPWCDFTNVNTTTFGPGDQILLARGSTWSSGMILAGAGSSGSYVTVGAYGSGVRPKISMSSGPNDICVYAENLDFWAFDSLDLSHCVVGIGIKYTSLGHEGLRFTNIVAHDMKNITFGWSATPPTKLPGVFYGTGIYVSSEGTAVPSAGQWVYKNVVVNDYEAYDVDNGYEFSANGFISTFPSNSAQNISVHRAHMYNTDGCSLIANSTNYELVDSVVQANGSRYQQVGTTGMWIWYSKDFSIINSVLGNTPDTGSPDQTGIDFEAYDENGTIRGSYVGGNGGSGSEVLGLPNRSGDYHVNHTYSGNAYVGNFTSGTSQPGGIRLDNWTGITMSGTVSNNLYWEPNTQFLSTSGSNTFAVSNNVQVASAASIFNQGKQYSVTQGTDGWRYQTYSGSWSNASYDSTNDRWGTASAYVNRFESLPAASASGWVAHTWTAPISGSVEVRSRVLKADIFGGDGVAVRITLNGTKIWPTSGASQAVASNDGIGLDANLSNLTVASGDVLRFEVNAGSSGNNSNDLTSWNPSIGYRSGAVNDDDPAVSYSGTWTDGNARGYGDYQDDEHWTTTNGDSVTYTCTSCSTLGVLSEKTPTSGNYDVQIDSGTAVSVNAYAPSRIARQLIFVRTGLTTGSHTITVTKTSGAYGEVDAFLINDPINDDDAAFAYTGSWTDGNARGYGDYRDDEHWTTTTGDSYLASFYGTGVALITETSSGGGVSTVQLCNAAGASCGSSTTFDNTVPGRTAQQIVWQNATPTALQQQTVKVVKSSGPYAEIDAIMVIP